MKKSVGQPPIDSLSEVRPVGAREVFLSCFSVRHRPEVIEFGKRLGRVDAHFLLFMARKAVCFYESLAALKLTELRGVLVSDRVMDMDLSWLAGRKVAIIDDAVIYGSTLANTATRLRAAGAIVSDIVVFCVNATSWKHELVKPTEPFLRLDERETTGFCADLVRAISVVPIPYAVDYPIIRRLRVSDDDLSQLLCLPGWGTKAHTTPLQHGAAVSALVATPTSTKLADIFPESETAIASVCHLVKIRLYGRHLDKHSATWFTVMPIAAFDPLAVTHVTELWRCVLASATEEEADRLRQTFISATSQLRAVQFIVAARVAKIWVRDARAMLGLRVSPRIDSGFAGFSFSPATVRLISSIAARGVDFSAATALKPATASMLRIEKPMDTYEPNPWSLQAALVKPFLDLHMQKEIPARQQRLPIEALPDPVLNRLNEGFSLPQLRQCVAAVSGTLPSFSILSEFLDYAIDRGFVVPILALHNNVVFRAYRYGEDVRDAEQFRHLCTLCAKSFLEASGSASIPRTWLEKLLVLLFQGLLNQRLLDPTDLAMGSSGTIGVRYALHGAVLKEAAPRIYSHYEGLFYIDVLSKYGHFRRADGPEAIRGSDEPSQSELPNLGHPEKKERGRYLVPIITQEPIPEATLAVEVAEALGLLFGSLSVKSLRSGSIGIDDLTLLATCHSPASTSAALAAELDILREDWRYTHRCLQTNDPSVTVAFLRSERWFIALNSARFKYRDYMLDASDGILDRIEAELVDAPDRESKFILSSLKSFRRQRLTRHKYSEVDPRYHLLVELGRLIYELNLLARLLMVGVGRFGGSVTAHQIKAELSELVAEHGQLLRAAIHGPQPQHLLRRNLINAVQRVMEPSIDSQALCQWATKLIALEVAHATEYLQRVDHLVARVGLPNRFDLYPHVVLVEPVNPTSAKRLERDIGRLLRQVVPEFNRRSPKGRAYAFAFCAEVNPTGSIAVGFRGDVSSGLFEHFIGQMLNARGIELVRRVWGFQDIDRDEQPLKSESSPRCIADMLWERAAACASHPLLQDRGIYRLLASDDQLRFDTPQVGPGAAGSVVTIAAPVEKVYSVQFAPIATDLQSGRRFQKTGHMRKADIGIICVTPSELRAIKDAMEALPDFVEEKKFEYFAASLPGDGCEHRVVMTYSSGQGNVPAGITASRFISKYQPRLLVMLGMAGSVHDDAKLLDVVISTQVIYYEPRKERQDGVSNRLTSLPISNFLKRVLTSFMADHGAPSTQLEYVDGGKRYSFSVLEGPLGTGEAIVGAVNSAARAIVKRCNDKTLVVETEAWGVHAAVHEHESTRRACKHVLTIKGVADCADEEKDDARQYRATRNAFETLRALLKKLAASDLV